MRVKRRERIANTLDHKKECGAVSTKSRRKKIKSKSQFVPKIELLLMVVKRDWTKQKTFFEVVEKGKKMRLEYKGRKKGENELKKHCDGKKWEIKVRMGECVRRKRRNREREREGERERTILETQIQ